MKKSLRIGINFGITSGIITTLGLMVGLMSGTHLKLAVIGGILTIAIADAMSDALGIHVSQEAAGKPAKEVWESTLATFAAKFLFALTFMIPVVLISNLLIAVGVSALWGIGALAYLSYTIAKAQGERPWNVIREHVLIALLVIVITYGTGMLIDKMFGVM